MRSEMADPPADRRRLRRIALRVLAVQVLTLAALALLQSCWGQA